MTAASNGICRENVDVITEQGRVKVKPSISNSAMKSHGYNSVKNSNMLYNISLNCTFEPALIAPVSSFPHAATCPINCVLMTSQIGIIRGFETSLEGGWRESIASSRHFP